MIIRPVATKYQIVEINIPTTNRNIAENSPITPVSRATTNARTIRLMTM